MIRITPGFAESRAAPACFITADAARIATSPDAPSDALLGKVC